MATKTKKTNPDRVAFLSTHVGSDPLIIRGNPSEEDIRSFVEEHNRRYHAGEPGGPDGLPAYLIKGAEFREHELAEEAEIEIDISDLL